MRRTPRTQTLCAMTTTMPDAGRSDAPVKVLRRSRTDRVGAGVAGGLGRYFGFDPVLFRVLFATAAFFGGAGVIAYVLAWIAIPEEGTQSAAVDRWVEWLRRRRVPVWVVAAAAGLLLWLIAFSWWQPHVFWPVIAAVAVLAIALARQSRQLPPATDPVPPPPGTATAPVDLTKSPTEQTPPGNAWRQQTAAWLRDAHQARLQRRRRSRPVRIATVVALVVTLASLATADAVSGIVLPAYFIVTLAIVGAGLLVGVVLRRTPWSLAVLLIPAIAGTVAFGGSGASLHDGIGQRTWSPTIAPAANYNLAFGQGVLDLRRLNPQSTPRVIHVRMAAGQLRIVAPASMRLTLDAHIRFGLLSVSRPGGFSRDLDHGAGVDRVLGPPAGATGQPVTVVATLADGHVELQRR